MSECFDSPSQEERELIRLAQGGDQSAMASLMVAYTPLVRRQAAGVFCAGAEQEDLMQEGFLGLVSAILTYDGEKSAAFSPYAAVCIRRSVLTAVRSASRMKHLPLNDLPRMSAVARKIRDVRSRNRSDCVPGVKRSGHIIRRNIISILSRSELQQNT